MKRYIRAMSTAKRILVLRIQDKSEILSEHLTKMYLYPEADCLTHWMQEAWAFFHSVPKLKHNNKLPSAKFIYENISVYIDQPESLIRIVKGSEKDLYTDRDNDVEGLVQFMEAYFSWISEELSKNESVTEPEAVDKLSDLLDKRS